MIAALWCSVLRALTLEFWLEAWDACRRSVFAVRLFCKIGIAIVSRYCLMRALHAPILIILYHTYYTHLTAEQKQFQTNCRFTVPITVCNCACKASLSLSDRSTMKNNCQLHHNYAMWKKKIPIKNNHSLFVGKFLWREENMFFTQKVKRKNANYLPKKNISLCARKNYCFVASE